MRLFGVSAVVLLFAGSSSPALAQRVPFSKVFTTAAAPVLEVRTDRGKIEVVAGPDGSITVDGLVTVRVGLAVPADAATIAQRVAEHPPIGMTANTVTLQDPSDPPEQRAVTVSYRVTVPRDTQVRSTSDSGETTVTGVAGAVVVRTQSAAIALERLGGSADVTTGSGAVRADGIGGGFTVSTASSAITGRDLGGDVRVRTQSGAVDVALIGTGAVDVHTASSGVRIAGARGALTTRTQSGRVTADGAPGDAWTITSGSGAVSITTAAGARFTLDASSGSGAIRVTGADVDGTVSKRRASGRVNGGGPALHVNTQSGAIEIQVGR